jgi:hypothetical protein
MDCPGEKNDFTTSNNLSYLFRMLKKSHIISTILFLKFCSKYFILFDGFLWLLTVCSVFGFGIYMHVVCSEHKYLTCFLRRKGKDLDIGMEYYIKVSMAGLLYIDRSFTSNKAILSTDYSALLTTIKSSIENGAAVNMAVFKMTLHIRGPQILVFFRISISGNRHFVVLGTEVLNANFHENMLKNKFLK